MPAVTLSSQLWPLQGYGPVAPSTLSGPVRQGLGRFGDGLFMEEGTSNLVTNPSFEAGTTGWSAVGTGTTIAADTSRSFIGTQALKVTPGSAAGAGASTTVTLAASTQYTASKWVYVPAGASPVALTLSGAAFTASVTGTASTLTGQWQRITATGTTNASGGAATATVATTTGNTTPFWVDAVQVEQKGYATSYCDGSLGTGYSWSGAANASTSTRVAAQYAAAMPATVGPLTVCAWVRVGEVTGGLQYIALLPQSGSFPALYFNNTGVSFASSVDVTATVTYSPTAGDVLFVAATLAADSKTYSVYLSRNGGAVVSATTAASGTAYGGASSINIGQNGAGAVVVDSVIDQLLVFNYALTSAQVSNLAFATNESTFASDPGIVFAAACGAVRGGTNTNTASGIGLYRATTSNAIAAYVESYAAGNGPDAVSGVTKKITVPAGSGIGQGQLVSLNAPTGGNVVTVQRVFSAGGVYDELYTT